LKKFLFVIVIFALLSFAACADTDHIPADTGSVPLDADGIPVTAGGMFCTADLPEGEVLTVHAGGDEVIFDSIEDMMSFGSGSEVYRDYVIRIEILDERVEWRNASLPFQDERALLFLGDDPGWDHSDRYQPSTIHRVRVLEVFQGEVEVGDILEVGQSGGQIDNVHFMNDAFLPLMPGDDLVLFLASFSWMTNEE